MRVMGLKKMRIAVGIVLLVVLATGCSSGEKRADSLELIQKDGVMSVAVPGNNSPYSAMSQGAASGTEVEFAKKLGEKLGVQVRFTGVEPSGLEQAVLDGNAQIALGRIAWSDGLKNRMAVSTAYDTGRLFVVTAKGNFSCTTGAFASASVGASQMLSEPAGILVNGIDGVTVVRYDSPDTVEEDILSGKIQGYFCYENQAGELMKRPSLQAQSVSGVLAEQYVVVMDQADENLKNQIDGMIGQMAESGELEELMNP